MRISLLLAISAWLAFSAAPRAYACSCVGYETQQEQFQANTEHAEVIFRGTVQEVQEVAEPRTDARPDLPPRAYRITLGVERYWKGDPDAFVTVQTPAQASACGIRFAEAGTYIVFANRTEEGHLTTHSCSGTMQVPHERAEDLHAFLETYENREEDPSEEQGTSSSSSHTSSRSHSSSPLPSSSSSAATSDGTTVFADVSKEHPHAQAIVFMYSQGIVEGYPDAGEETERQYRPETPINRAEFTKIIIETLERSSADSCAEDLSDVPANAWFSDYVCTAYSEGIIDGYPDGTFGPAQTINVAEAAKIVVNAFELPTENGEEEARTWWRPYIHALARADSLPATITDPNQKLTRGGMAAIMHRVMKAADE